MAVDLDACDREPIHLIGAVQPHGALIGVDEHSEEIVYASVNAAEFTGREPDVLIGSHIKDCLGADNYAALDSVAVAPSKPELLRPWFIDLPFPDGTFHAVECLPHRHGGLIILEFVHRASGPADVWEEELLRQRIISDLIKPRELDELAQVAADIIQAVTGFERVMIYRFAEDKHGEVIAESTVRSDSFLGLHYPASDIPDPARRHFALNVIRTIGDINATPLPIVDAAGTTADADAGRPLDLTYSKLRAVAPVHIEYLNNMGVGASMSISLITNDELWGLVACHHYGPRQISSSRLRFVELLGGTISVLLQSIENAAQLKQSIRAEKLAHEIEVDARTGMAMREALFARADRLMDLFDAHGLVVRTFGQVDTRGVVPSPPLRYRAMRTGLVDGVATSSHVAGIMDLDEEQTDVAAGAAYLELSEDGTDHVVLLRPHYEETITWAGKPEKVETTLEDGTVRLSPRGSFALWREERRGHSKPFSATDLEALRIVRRALFALNSLEHERVAREAQKSAEDEEARLRIALMDAARTSSMGELASALAHELNQPLSAVSNYISACRQELRNSGLDLPPRVDDLIDSAVSESSRAGDLIRRLRDFIARGDLKSERVDLHTIIRQGVDLALSSSPEPAPEVRMPFDANVPPIWADEVQIGQVVHNLVRNSLAAMTDQRERMLTIATKANGETVEVSVTDTGRGIAKDQEKSLFDPFHSSTTHGLGIGLSLCRSIVEAHGGRIRSEPCASGAKIVFTLRVSEGSPK